jgi:hypothetical protein
VLIFDGIPLFHAQITTEDEAISLGNAMAATGNYPVGMSPCFVAGINGDQIIEDHCIFDERLFCKCEEQYGFTPRSQCAKHSEEEHLFEVFP